MLCKWCNEEISSRAKRCYKCGTFQPPYFFIYEIILVIIPIIAVILLIFNVFYYKTNDEVLSRTYIIAFSLIMGGAIGNLIDRITYGYVIDFIDFRIWPVFNVADSAITIGAILIAFKCIQLSGKKDRRT